MMPDILLNKRSFADLDALASNLGDEALQERAKDLATLGGQRDFLPNADQRLATELEGLFAGMFGGEKEAWPKNVRDAFGSIYSGVGFGSFDSSLIAAMQNLRTDEAGFMAFNAALQVLSGYPEFSEVAGKLNAALLSSNIIPEGAARAGLGFVSNPATLVIPIWVGGAVGRLAAAGLARFGAALGLATEAGTALSFVGSVTAESAGFVGTSRVIASASEAISRAQCGSGDCFVANAPRNDILTETTAATFLFAGLRLFGWTGQLAQSLLPATEFGAATAKLLGHTASVTGLATMDKVQVAAGITPNDSATYYEALVRAFFLHITITGVNSVVNLEGAKSESLEIQRRAELITEFFKRLAENIVIPEVVIENLGNSIEGTRSPLTPAGMTNMAMSAKGTSGGGKLAATMGDVQALGETSDKRDVLRRAVLDLKDTQGKRKKDAAPSAGDILSAVKRVYRGLFGVTGQFDSSQQYTVDKLTKALSSWMDEAKAAALNIQGTKEPEKREPKEVVKRSSDASLKNLATRIATAAVVADEIATNAAKLPVPFLEYLSTKGITAPEKMARAANDYAATLKGFGDTKERIAQELAARSKKEIDEVFETVEEIESLRDEVRSLVHESLVVLDIAEIDRFMGYIQADVDSWMKELPPEQRANEEILKKVVRNYVGFWLNRNEGNTPPRLTLSGEDLYDAVLKTARDLKVKVPKDLARGGMVEYLVFKEAWRDRRSAADAGADDGVARRPLLMRSISGEADLTVQIGGKLTDGYRAFFNAILNGELDSVKTLSERERRDLSLRWREAFIYMVRYGVGTYGEHFNEEHIKKTGLEPRLVRPIFRRLKDTNIYTDQVLELVREFYRTHVTSDENLVPPVDKLRPKYIGAVTSAQSAGDITKRFISPKGPDMEALVKELTFIAGENGFEEDFREAAGITWASFKGYGKVRARPEVLTRQMMEAFVDTIIPASDLKQFLLEHTPSSAEWQLNWTDRVEKAEADGRLKELALSREYKTDVVTRSDWERYVAYSNANGHPEDVTVGPSTERAYIAVMKAYRFLSELAVDNGLYIDAVDLVSAISPVVRRMRDSAIDGVIAVEIPSFMRKVMFRNIGQPTFTQKMNEMGLSSMVKQATLEAHESGDTRNPLYETLRKNAASLAAQVSGGRDVEDNIYHLQVMFRFGYFLENFALVLNPLGGKESFVPDNVPTRYTLRLVSDTAEYQRSEAVTARGVRDSVMLKVRSGFYDKLIANVRDYLVAVQRLPFKYELMRADGSAVQMEGLLKALEGFESSHIFNGTALKDQTSLLSLDEIQKIEDSYKELASFAQEVHFFLRVRGEIEMKGGKVLFDAAPRIEGYRYDSSSIGRVPLFLDDIEPIAQAEKWPEARRSALITMRALAGQLLLEGAIKTEELADGYKLAAMAQQRWPLDVRLVATAAEDFVRLEKGAMYSRLIDTAGNVAKKRGAAQSGEPRPALPWWAPKWGQQFREIAEARGIKGEAIEKATAALKEYFETVKGFRKFYFGNILDGLIEKHLGGLKGGASNEARAAIDEFMARTGLPHDAKTEAKTGAAKKTPEDIAREATQKYASMFSSGKELNEQLPEDEAMLKDLVNLLCLEHGEVEATLTFERARDQLRTFNRGRSPSPLLAAHGEERLPQKGLLAKRLEGLSAEDRQRFYQLLPLLATPEKNVIPAEAGSSRDSRFRGNDSPPLVRGNDISKPLAAVVKDLKASLGTWENIISDPEYGVVRHIRRMFNAPYFSDEKLRQFARAYGRLMLLTDGRVDIPSFSRDTVNESFAPYENITEKMARYMRFLLEEYLTSRMGEIRVVAEFAREAFKLASEESQLSEISTWEKFYRMAASRDVGEYLEQALKEEAQYPLLAEMFGERAAKDGVIAYAEGLFKVIRERCEGVAAEAAKDGKEMDAKAAEVTVFRDDVLKFAIEEYLPKGIDSLDKAACERAITQMGQGLEILLGLERRAATMGKVLEQIDDLALKLSEPELPELVQEGRLEQAEELRSGVEEATATIKEFKERLVNGKAEAAQRIKDIETAAEAARVKARAGRVIAGIDEMVGKMDDIIARWDRDVVKETEALRDSVEHAKLDVSTYEGFGEDFKGLVEILRVGLKKLEAKADGLKREKDGIDTSKLEAEAGQLSSKLDIQTKALLSEAVQRLADRRATLFPPQGVEDEALDAATKIVALAYEKINEAEDRLPIKPPLAVLPEEPVKLPDGESVTVGGTKIQFNPEQPKEDYGPFIARELQQILWGRVLSFMKGSVIISPEEAARVAKWRDGDRRDDLAVSDILGNEIILPVGVRVAALSEDPSIAKVARVLELISRENSYEGYLLAQLFYRKGNRPILFNLFGTIMNEAEVANIDEARSLVRRWALAAGGSIEKALGKKAERLFIEIQNDDADRAETREPSALAKQWEFEFGSEHTPAKHAEGRKNVEIGIEMSTWGKLDVRNASGEWTHLFIEPASGEAYENGKSKMVHAFDREKGTMWIELGSIEDGIVKEITFTPPIANNPRQLNAARIALQVFSDPSLRPLGWLVREMEAERLDEGLAQYIMGCLENNPGLSLLELQDEALGAYWAYTHGVSSKPEVQHASVKWLNSYMDDVLDKLLYEREHISTATIPIDSVKMFIDSLNQITKIIKKSDTARHHVAMLAYLGLLKMNELEIYIIKTLVTASEGRGVDGIKERLESAEAFNKTAVLYMKHRREIIEKNRGALQDATGQARPWLSWLFILPDADMLERFPETGRAFSQRMKRDWGEALKERDGGVCDLLKLAVLRFPEFLPIWMFIDAVTSGGKHDTFGLSRVLDIVEAFGKLDVRAAEDQIGEFQDKILDYYGSIRGRVLDILRKVSKTAALNDWSGVSPIEHLRAVVPEAFLVKDGIVGNFRAAAEKTVRAGAGIENAVYQFVADFPEFTSVAVSSMVVAGIGKEVRGPADVFQRYADTLKSGGKVDCEAIISELVAALLDPIYIAALRGTLSARLVQEKSGLSIEGYIFSAADKTWVKKAVDFLKMCGGKPGQTVGEILFGTKGPWFNGGNGPAGGQNVNVIDTAAEGFEIDRLGPELDSYINRTEANKGDRPEAEAQKDLDEAVTEYNETQFPELRYIKLNEMNRFVDGGYRKIIQTSGNGKRMRRLREGIGVMADLVKTMMENDATARRHIAMLMLMNDVGDKDAQQYIYEILLRVGKERHNLKDPASIAETEMFYRKSRGLILEEKKADLQRWSGLQRPWLSELWAVPDPEMMERFPETAELYPPTIRARWKGDMRSGDNIRDTYHEKLRLAAHAFPELLPIWTLIDIGLMEGNVISQELMEPFKDLIERYMKLPVGAEERVIEAYKEKFRRMYATTVRPEVLKVARALKIVKKQDISVLPVVQEWEKKFGAEWTPEMHAKEAEENERDLRLAAWGMARFNLPNGSTRDFRVEPKSFAAFAKKERKTVTVFENGRIAEVDLASVAMELKPDATDEEMRQMVDYMPPIADSATALTIRQFRHRIFNDPDLRPVGWILQNGKMEGEAAEMSDRLLTELLLAIDIVSELGELTKIVVKEDKEPGSTPVNFKNMTSMERLKMVVPEFFKVRGSAALALLKSCEGDPKIQQQYKEYPELALAAIFAMMVAGVGKEKLPAEIFVKYLEAIDRGEPFDNEAFVREYVEASLDPIYIAALRGTLDARLARKDGVLTIEGYPTFDRFVAFLVSIGGQPGQTVGEILFGTKGP